MMSFSNSLAAAEYKVAVRAHHGVEHAFKRWQPTVDKLNKQLPQHNFTLVPIISLKEITQRASRSEFDFVLTNPSSYVEIEQMYGAKSMVTLNNKRGNSAQSRFGSVIFTHASNSDILNLKDLNGKTLMAVSESAFGGWRVAWVAMLEQGFVPHKNLKKLVYAKNKTQPEVVWAVRDKKVHAGVVRTDRLERMEAAGKIDMRYFRILNNQEERDFPFFLSSKLYPEWPFVALKHVPVSDVDTVTNALLKIEENSRAAQLGKYVGWVLAKDYEPVRVLMKRLRIGPYVK